MSIYTAIHEECLRTVQKIHLRELELWNTHPETAIINCIATSDVFDVEWYLKEYPDVAASDIDPILHYVRYGEHEGRFPNKSFKTINRHDLVNFIKYNYLNTNNLNEKKSVDIIIPIHNAIEDIKECIESLKKTTQNIDCNIIIIDDNSDIETIEYIKMVSEENKFILIRNNNHLGYTKSINIGISNSKSEIVILLNSDTITTKNWIENIIKCINSDEKIGIIGPLSNAAWYQSVPEIYDYKNNVLNSLPEHIDINLMAYIINETSLRKYPEATIINGFCFIVKRQVFDVIGYFDDINFPFGYGEEDDFCFRALRAGFKLAIADDTYIYHKKSKSFGHNRRFLLSKIGTKKLKSIYGEDYKKYIEYMENNIQLNAIRENIKKMLT